MKIIVGGAGSVGSSIIGYLTQGNNDIIVIDTNAKHLEDISQAWDIRPILGSVSYPSILEKADAKNADLLLAVTDSDEVNIVACRVAHSLFDVPQKIARIDSEEFLAPSWSELFSDSKAPIDLIISPNVAIANAVYNLIKLPGASEFQSLLEEKLHLVAFYCSAKCPLIKTPLIQLSLLAPELDVSFVCIVRNDVAFVPKDEDILDIGDEVYFLVEQSKLDAAVHAFDMDRSVIEKVVIFGGSQISLYLARQLEKDDNIVSCKIIENNSHQAGMLAKALNNTAVIHGDLMNSNILREAGIESADVVVSLTESDEDNMLSSLLAQRLGAASTISLINSGSYTNLSDSYNNILVDRAAVTISHILKEIRKAKIRKAYSLGQGYGEVWEVKISETSQLLEKKISQIKLPKNCRICAVQHNDKVLFPAPSEIIRHHDIVVLYVGADAVKKAEKMFS